MRAAPPVEVALNRFGIWRGALATLVTTMLGANVAWFVTRDETPLIARSLVIVAALALAACTSSLLGRPLKLRWNGESWQCAPADPGAVWSTGAMRQMIDLGFWMLLRFDAESSDPSAHAVLWIPVQRRGLEGEWHALRCALRSPGTPGAS